MRSNSSSIYRWVVDDVISKMKPEFIQEGVDESILDTLRAKWEAKLTQNGLITEGDDQGTRAPPPSGSNNNLSGGMMPLPPQLQQQLIMQQQQQQRMQQQVMQQQQQHRVAHRQQQPGVQRPMQLQGQQMHPQLQMQQQMQQQQPRMQQQQMLQPGMPGPSMASQPQGVLGKRKEPEQGQNPQQQQLMPGQSMPHLNSIVPPGMPPKTAAQDPTNSRIPQRDGPDDDEDEDTKAGAGEAGGSGAGTAELAEDEILSDDSEVEEAEEEVTNFLCCQFEKVARTKNRWKIAMREGVFHIDGKDYLFKKANGEWTF